MDLQQALEPSRDRDWLLVEQSYDPLAGEQHRIALRRQQRLPRRPWGSGDQPRPYLGILVAYSQMGLLAADLCGGAVRYA